ncbi:MAG: hypothetical protein R3296_15140 [Oleiphilaceae bacterium]|nr:hypothetical protein [Oleiphilaceae bacterium]
MAISTAEWSSHNGNDDDSVRGEPRSVRRLARQDWEITLRTRTLLRSDSEYFYLQAEMDSYEGDRRVHSHRISRRIPRNLV